MLVVDPPPWYAATPVPARGRRELEDEHTRILAQAVGDHLPYELALRAAELQAHGVSAVAVPARAGEQLEQPMDAAAPV